MPDLRQPVRTEAGGAGGARRRHRRPEPGARLTMPAAGLAGAIAASAAVVAALAGVVQLGRWRNTGEAPAPWLAAGLLVYSGAALAVPGVALLVAPTAASPGSSVALIRPLAVPVVAALFTIAAGARAEQAPATAARAAAHVGVVAAVAAAGVAWSPTIRATLGPSLVTGAGTGPAAIGQVVVAGGWVALAGVFARRRRRDGDVGAWVVVLLAALGASRLSLGLEHWGVPAPAALAAAQALRMAGVVAAMVGALRGLQSLVAALRVELAAARAELGAEHFRLQAALAADGSRRHQLRNGLAAIGGTAWLLEHHERALDTGQRTELIEGVTVEVRRLQRLLDVANAPDTSNIWEGR